MPKKQSSVVPVSPKTGKVLKRVRKGQQVQYAVRGPRGGIKVIRKQPQEFFKSDLAGLNRQIARTDGKNFYVYEQFNKLKKEVKITYAQPRRKQRPALYVNNKKVRETDIGFKKGHYARARAMRELTIITPKTSVSEVTLQGDTIKQALSGLDVNASIKDLFKRKKGLYYSVVLKITTPTGEVIKIPAKDADYPDGFDRKFARYMQLPGEKGRTKGMVDRGREIIDPKTGEKRFVGIRLANLKRRMSRSIRLALKDKGYRFTSLKKLKQIEARESKRIAKMKREGVDQDAIDNAEEGLERLTRLGTYTYAGDLKYQIDKNYDVKMFIEFEEM